MSDKNIRLKIKNGVGGYDVIFPETKPENVIGLTDLLLTKVDKVTGKGLSVNDYTNEEKAKLAGITDSIKAEITNAAVVAAIGFTPENVANKGAANGYASLDVNGKLLIAQYPDGNKARVFVVADSVARLALTGTLEADRCFETVTGDTYIYDGAAWVIMADADWANVKLEWANIIDKPLKFDPTDHTHAAIDIVESDVKQFVTVIQKASWSSKTNITIGTVEPTTQQIGDVWFEEIV